MSNLAFEHPAVAILGSARSDGHTAKVLARLIDGRACEVYDLNVRRIAPFRYDQVYPADDEFLPVIEKMIRAPLTIFATPVYWYAYSWMMKSFIDRLSDLLKSQRDVGRRLRGRRFALLTTASDDDPDSDVESAFARLCDYLCVECASMLYAVEDGPITNLALAEQLRNMMPVHAPGAGASTLGSRNR